MSTIVKLTICLLSISCRSYSISNLHTTKSGTIYDGRVVCDTIQESINLGKQWDEIVELYLPQLLNHLGLDSKCQIDQWASSCGQHQENGKYPTTFGITLVDTNDNIVFNNDDMPPNYWIKQLSKWKMFRSISHCNTLERYLEISQAWQLMVVIHKEKTIKTLGLEDLDIREGLIGSCSPLYTESEPSTLPPISFTLAYTSTNRISTIIKGLSPTYWMGLLEQWNKEEQNE